MQSQSSQNKIEPSASWWQSDDAWAMIMAAGLLVIAWFALQPVVTPLTGETLFENMLSPWVAKPGSWSINPLVAFDGVIQGAGPSKGFAVLATAVGCITVFVFGLAGTGIPLRKSLPSVTTVTRAGGACMVGKYPNNNKKSAAFLCALGICRWTIHQ